MSRPSALAPVALLPLLGPISTGPPQMPSMRPSANICGMPRHRAVQIVPGVSVSTVIAYFFCISAAIFGFKRFAHSGAVGYASVAS